MAAATTRQMGLSVWVGGGGRGSEWWVHARRRGSGLAQPLPAIQNVCATDGHRGRVQRHVHALPRCASAPPAGGRGGRPGEGAASQAQGSRKGGACVSAPIATHKIWSAGSMQASPKLGAVPASWLRTGGVKGGGGGGGGGPHCVQGRGTSLLEGAGGRARGAPTPTPERRKSRRAPRQGVSFISFVEVSSEEAPPGSKPVQHIVPGMAPCARLSLFFRAWSMLFYIGPSRGSPHPPNPLFSPPPFLHPPPPTPFTHSKFTNPHHHPTTNPACFRPPSSS